MHPMYSGVIRGRAVDSNDLDKHPKSYGRAMTWANTRKVMAMMGVLGTLAVVSGADFLDTFACWAFSFSW